ncbi:MAG TPA: hypothetical protein VKB67_04240 [Rhizomicrobium sp.]|nr:hypothetical protein [Rhizomicrobium sp.]
MSNFAAKTKLSATWEYVSLPALMAPGNKLPDAKACHYPKKERGRDFVML